MNWLQAKNRFFFESPLSAAEADAALRENTDKRRFIRFTLPFINFAGKPFEGKIAKKGFIIRRILGYQNSFAPDIRGEINEKETGSVIRIKMSMPELASFFHTIVGFVMFPAMLLARLFSDFLNDLPLGFLLLFPGIYLAFLAAYHFEVSLAKDELSHIFRSQPKNDKS